MTQTYEISVDKEKLEELDREYPIPQDAYNLNRAEMLIPNVEMDTIRTLRGYAIQGSLTGEIKVDRPLDKDAIDNIKHTAKVKYNFPVKVEKGSTVERALMNRNRILMNL